MQVRNLTPHPHLVYANEDAQARLFDILIVKSSFYLNDVFELVPAIEQEPLTFSDACFGEVNVTSLRSPSDLVPYKPRTDVVVVANTYAPNGKPSTDWTCGVSVTGPAGFSKKLRVTGPRHWDQKGRKSWSLSTPEKVDHVPLRYEYAFGGEINVADDNVITDERNPLGVGLIDKDSVYDAPVPAPQIEAASLPIRDPHRRYEPEGLGPIPPAWLPRRPLGGTYDADWLENTWPHWAADYDFAFHNSAGKGMKADGFLTGDETISLTSLRTDCPNLSLQLPGDTVIAHLIDYQGGRKMIALNLDTIYIDLLPEDPTDCLISLTWRMPFLDAEVARLEIDSTVVANPIRLWSAGDGILTAPHPSDLFTLSPVHEVAHVE